MLMLHTAIHDGTNIQPYTSINTVVGAIEANHVREIEGTFRDRLSITGDWALLAFFLGS